MNGKVYQLMVGCGKEEYEALLKDVDGARITAWWPRAADITPAKGNKGVGVEKVLEYYHLKKRMRLPLVMVRTISKCCRQ